MSQPNAPIRIAIAGELSIFTAAGVQERLLQAFANGAAVDVDLAEVSEIDSAGIQVMLAAKRSAAAQSLPLRFTGHSPAVVDILQLCQLSELLGCADASGESA
jgi:anti-anti-sigma factor